eukprot:IDg2287t1
MLADIDGVTKLLQSKCYILAQCREDLDILIDSVSAEKNNSESTLYQCKLGTKYIAKDAEITSSPCSESGAVKIQIGLEYELSRNEKFAVEF